MTQMKPETAKRYSEAVALIEGGMSRIEACKKVGFAASYFSTIHSKYKKLDSPPVHIMKKAAPKAKAKPVKEANNQVTVTVIKGDLNALIRQGVIQGGFNA